MGAPWASCSCPRYLQTWLHFPSELSLAEIHTGTTGDYRPATTVHQLEFAPLSPQFHLVPTIGQIPSTCFTPADSPFFFWAYIGTTHNNSSWNSAMIPIATDIFATSMQPYPSYPYLSWVIHLLIKTVSIGLSQMETSHRPPSSSVTPYFTAEPLCFVASPFPILQWNPSNPLQDINKISIDFEKPRHMLFFRFKENSYFRRYLVAPSFESNHHKQGLLITTSRIYWSPQEICLIACSNFKL